MTVVAGRLNKRITLQSATLARDGHGQPIETWADVATMWAAVEPIRGREYFAAQQVSAETTHRVTLRHRAGVSPQMRVAFGSRTFRIESVIDPLEKNERIELMCVEVL
mgnify:CR=1 FL=1